MKMYEILGIITARAGSKGIINKNMKLLNGIPLTGYTFKAVKESKLLSRCILSTDDLNLIEYAIKQGMEVPFKRPECLASDTAKSIDVIIHALNFLKESENYIPNYIMILQPTSPLRTGTDIDESIKLILLDKDADSLVSVEKIDHKYVPENIMVFDGIYLQNYIDKSTIVTKQEAKIYYARNGAVIYITSYDMLMKKRRIIGDKCLPYFMPKSRSIDIDDMYDWKIAEMLLKGD